jgi:hypothetical protein
MVRQNAKLWYKVAQLHILNLEDIENRVAILRKPLPLVPNRNTGYIPVSVVNMHAFDDTQDHLLLLDMEKAPINFRTSSVHSVPEPGANSTQSPKRPLGPTWTK